MGVGVVVDANPPVLFTRVPHSAWLSVRIIRRQDGISHIMIIYEDWSAAGKYSSDEDVSESNFGSVMAVKDTMPSLCWKAKQDTRS
jgi:hypothetical protein